MNWRERWFPEQNLNSLLSTNQQIQFWRSHLPLWLSAVIVALFSAFYSQLFLFSEELILKIMRFNPLWIFVAAPIGFLASRLVVEFFCPSARGSGIPQVLAAIHSSREQDSSLLDRLLPSRLIWAKVIGSCAAVSAGAATGREGPTLQISAALFRWLDSLLPTHWPRPPQHHLIIAGSSAGLAAAFNAPLGGVVFAIEELAREHLNVFRSSLLQSVIVSGLCAQILLGGYLFFGHPPMPSFSLLSVGEVVVVGLVSSICAAVFTETLIRTNQLLRFPSKFKRLLVAFCGGLLFAFCVWIFGKSTLGSGKHFIETLIVNTPEAASPDQVLARLFGALVTYSSGVVGGVFVPAMAAGASLGSMMGGLFGASTNLLILAGMTAFLTSTTGTPFTSAVLVGEMAGASDQMLFLMLSALIAHSVTRIVRRQSFYEILAQDFLPNETH